MTTVVRAGVPSDVGAAVAVWQSANTARRGGIPVPVEHEQRVRGYLAMADSFLAIAEDGDRLVGMALGMQAREDDGTGPPIPRLCHISMVFVDPDRWGEGIAKRLMRHLFAQAQERGYERYQLWTQADNHRAQALYEGLGFGPSGREKDDDLGERTVHYELPPRLWDESLYAGSAEYYAVGRLPYPQRLAGAIRGHLALDGRGRLLDLGCDTGSLTLLLAPLFDRVGA